MIRIHNATVTDVSTLGYYVPIEDYWIIGILLISIFILTMVSILGVLFINRRLDRYRLKYGFDRELEIKDIKEKTEMKKQKRLDKIQKAFERRVFKD